MLHYETLYVGGGQKALLNHVLILLQQRVKEAARVQQRDGLVVNLELALAQKFRKFFQRSEPPCASDNTATASEVAAATTVWGGRCSGGVRLSGGTGTYKRGALTRRSPRIFLPCAPPSCL
jgi:hypothetical protein